MRFGHFFYPMVFDDSNDSAAIDQCMFEAELVEELGFDAIWFAEHHFTGEVVYGDPLVLAGAVAAKTKRILLGFGIVEMALHHPVRLAIQTAVLDNLSHGRVILGTGRGATFNTFEYVGFGTTPAQGVEQLREAEDLLITAWTKDEVHYNGKYWQVSFPSVRPRPYQKPHPPLPRACIDDNNIMEMARAGRPLLYRGRTNSDLKRVFNLYSDTLREAGFSDQQVEGLLDQCWVWREAYLAESDDQALDEFIPAFVGATQHLIGIQGRWNPKDIAMPTQTVPLDRNGYGAEPDPESPQQLVGSPRRVADQIAGLRDAGVRNLMLTHRSLMPRGKVVASLRMLSEQVAPKFR